MKSKPEIRGPKLLVRKYTKPERIGSILTNPAWRQDNSRSLWEVVETTEAANEALGVTLEPDWILVTAPNAGVFWSLDDAQAEVYLLAASSVVRVIPWTTESEAVKLTGTRMLVRKSEPKKQKGAIYVPDVAQGRVLTGKVVEIGPEVEDVEVGADVLFTAYVGVDVEVNGEKMMILAEEQVMAILEGEEVEA